MRLNKALSFGVMCLLPLLTISSLKAECAKCAKIEAERENEKALHPQPKSDYYEDRINLDHQLSYNDDPAIDNLQNQGLKPGLSSENIQTARQQNSQQYPSIIYSILKSPDLIETLKNPFTIFVPSNDALRQIPMDELQRLIRSPNNEQLNHLVRNHLVAKKITQNDFINQSASFQTIGKTVLVLKEMNGQLTVNGKKVLKVDTLGNDGTIYVIDQVLLTK